MSIRWHSDPEVARRPRPGTVSRPMQPLAPLAEAHTVMVERPS